MLLMREANSDTSPAMAGGCFADEYHWKKMESVRG